MGPILERTFVTHEALFFHFLLRHFALFGTRMGTTAELALGAYRTPTIEWDAGPSAFSVE
jgi:hypothetical protein